MSLFWTTYLGVAIVNGRLRDHVIAQASRIAGLELVVEAYASKERTDETSMGD